MKEPEERLTRTEIFEMPYSDQIIEMLISIDAGIHDLHAALAEHANDRPSVRVNFNGECHNLEEIADAVRDAAWSQTTTTTKCHESEQVRWFRAQHHEHYVYISIDHIASVVRDPKGGCHIYTDEASESAYIDDRSPEEVIAAIDRAKADTP